MANISLSYISFIEILSQITHTHNDKPIILVFNKSDVSDPITSTYIMNIFRINELILQYSNIHIIIGTSFTLQLSEILYNLINHLLHENNIPLWRKRLLDDDSR
jgi:hypothetical protein